MKRITGIVFTLATVSGCVTTGQQMPSGGGWGAGSQPPSKVAPQTPGTVGPWGEPAPAPAAKPGASAAGGNGITPTSATVAAATKNHGGYPQPAPPMPGGPGPLPLASMMAPQGQVYAQGALRGGPDCPMPIGRSQVRFAGPAGGKIGWYVPSPVPDKDGKAILTPYKLDIPGRYNFLQASIYRLKLSDIPGRPGLQLYPTIEVVPAGPKTEAFLAHNCIPVEFTEEDFDQVTAGNFITKVIYLPDGAYNNPVAGGPEELVSTRLEPGVDPVAEAHRRGHILLIVRLGGIELESINSPPLDGAGMYGAPRLPTAGGPAMPGQPGAPAMGGVAPVSSPPVPPLPAAAATTSR
jgi:hypothetical protein